MASELLKNRALIQKLKEPEIPKVNFGLDEVDVEFVLPESKPQELLDIQEDARIQRQQDTMDKARPFLMDESVDFIEREEFNNGSKKFRQVTDEEFIKLYKEFQSLDNLGTDSEFVDFLNKKRIKPGTLGDPRLYSKNERFTTRTASGRRQRLNLKTKVKPYVSPKKQAEVDRINKVIQKEVNIANKGNKYISPSKLLFKVEDQLGIKPYFLDRINAQGKKIKVRSAALKPNSYPAIRNLDSMITKVDNVLKEMLISEEPLNDYFYKELSKRTGIEQKTLTKIRNDVPTYKVIADQGADKLLRVANAPYLKKLNLSQQLVEGLEMQKGLPRFVNTEEGIKYITRPRANVMQFARRSWNNNKGQGEIKFFDKNGKLIKWERGLELPYKNVSFSYGGKKYNVSNLIPSLVQKDFPEVKKVTEAANKLRTTEIDNPFKPGKKITVNSLIRKIQIDGYKWNPKLGTINILHGPEGVANKPFTDLTYNTRDINQLEAGFTSSLKAGNITETQYKKVIKELYKPFVKGDVDKAIIDRITKQAQQIEKGKFYGFEDLKTKLGEKKLTAFQELINRKGSGVDPSLLLKAGFEEFVKPTGKFAGQVARGVGTGADLAISAGKGATGLAIGALLEADPIITGMSEGKTFGQTARDTFIGTAIDAIPGVNLGSLNEDLMKLADTDEQRDNIRNLIDYQNDADRFKKRFANYQYLESNPLEAEGIDLIEMEKSLLNEYFDLQTRKPNVINKDTFNTVETLARKEATNRFENLRTGLAGKIFGDFAIQDPDFIDEKTDQITKASVGQVGATDSYTDNYKFLPQPELSPEELDEIYESGILAMANGGRIGFADGPKDPKRRLFLKLMGGIMSLPFIPKFMKQSEVAKPIVKVAGSSTRMPDWFPDMINKVMFGGTGKKVDADLTVYEPKELPGISIGRYDDGRVFVEGENEYGKKYMIEYEPPGYELIDEKTGKAVKKPGEFIAQEEVPVNVDPDGNADFDVEVLEDLDQILGPDTRAMEKYATGKKIKDMKSGEFAVGKAEADADRAIEEAAELDEID